MYEIITDTSANLDVALLRQQGIGVIPFSFYLDGQETRCTDTEQFDARAFYDGMRRGTPVTTSQLTPQRYLDCFAPLLAAGRDILFVGMSSGVLRLGPDGRRTAAGGIPPAKAAAGGYPVRFAGGGTAGAEGRRIPHGGH